MKSINLILNITIIIISTNCISFNKNHPNDKVKIADSATKAGLYSNIDTIIVKFHFIDLIKLVDTISNSELVDDNNYKDVQLRPIVGSLDEHIDDSINVIRKDKDLQMRLKNGKSIILINNRGKPELEFNDNNYIQYIYLHKVSNLFWLIYINYGHPCSGTYELIDTKNGEKFDLSGHPIISPDNNYIITGFVDECVGHYIELYKVNNSKIKLIKQIYFSKADWWTDKIGWINNSSIMFQGSINSNKISYAFIKIK